MASSQTYESRFAAYLAELASHDNRAALADLRRGLGKEPGAEPRMFPYVVPWLPQHNTGDVRPWQTDRLERNCFLVASLFGAHPLSWPPGREPRNFGVSFSLLANRHEAASVERRFLALLQTHYDDLPKRLRHCVTLLRSWEVPVDWAELLRDLRWWDHPEHRVQRAWARSFYREAANSQ